MVFSSAVFLFFFLPIVLLTYYLLPKRFKNLFLLISSLIFYTWGEGALVSVMLASTIIDYLCAIAIDKGYRRFGIVISIVINLSFLFYFKYFNFAFDNYISLLDYFNISTSHLKNIPKVILPMGISFYIFQTLSYTIDVYKKEVKANYNFVEFATYVTVFPQLVAGPIVRYIDIEKQLQTRRVTINNLKIGIKRFIKGFAKKMIIANTFAEITDSILTHQFHEIPSLYLWISVLSYALQIYFDFSGYSDMAIGLGKMLGFDFLENFNYPYISKSLTEFWRRWHISLSTWFKDYLYIPMGGNRISKYRTYFNLIFVFFITGLWHGASWNFIFWGLFHGLILIIERLGFSKILNQIPVFFQHLYLVIVVLIGWVFFRIEKFDDSLDLLYNMFSFSRGNISLGQYFNMMFFPSISSCIILIVFVYFCTPHYKKYSVYLSQKTPVLHNFLYLLLYFISLTYLSAGVYNPFIYFRF